MALTAGKSCANGSNCTPDMNDPTVPSAAAPVPLSPGDDHFQPCSPFLRRHLSVERARARWRPPDINSSFLDFFLSQ